MCGWVERPHSQKEGKPGGGLPRARHGGQDDAERNSPPWHAVYHRSILKLTWHGIYEGLYHPYDVEDRHSCVRPDQSLQRIHHPEGRIEDEERDRDDGRRGSTHDKGHYEEGKPPASVP